MTFFLIDFFTDLLGFRVTDFFAFFIFFLFTGFFLAFGVLMELIVCEISGMENDLKSEESSF